MTPMVSAASAPRARLSARVDNREGGDERQATPIWDVNSCPVESFCLVDQLPRQFEGPWHEHQRAQLLYANQGALRLEVTGAQWTLPPQRAALIPSKERHRVRCLSGATLCTVYFAPDVSAGSSSGVFTIPPVAREMLLYARRWGPQRAPSELLANDYFNTLAGMAREWIRRDHQLCLPVPASPDLQRALHYLQQNLRTATVAGAAVAAKLSPRTLSRRIQLETGHTLRQLLRATRVLRAMEQLADPDSNITETAFAVGFDDSTTLTRAFREVLGELPSDYRRRVASG